MGKKYAVAIYIVLFLGLLGAAGAMPLRVSASSPPVYELDSLLAPFGNNISVYYENLETGFVYRHNADRVYFSASVTKAFYALYLYQRAERGEISLDSTITFLQQDFLGGSGVIQHRYQVGAAITQRELLRLNISESDNIATLMLRRVHGLYGYRQFIADIGGTPGFVRGNIFNSHITANEAGLFAREIFQYVESGGLYSHEFRAHLLDNQFPFIVSDYPVASKTGWTRGYAWHDMAIVYAPSPFVLVILSARERWTEADYQDFAEISMAFQQFNDMWFAPPEPTPEPELPEVGDYQPDVEYGEDVVAEPGQQDWQISLPWRIGLREIVVALVAVLLLLLFCLYGYWRYLQS